MKFISLKISKYEQHEMATCRQRIGNSIVAVSGNETEKGD